MLLAPYKGMQRHHDSNSSTLRKMHPGGVCQLTALDPDSGASNAPIAIKIIFYDLLPRNPNFYLETLQEWEGRVSKKVPSSAASTANTTLLRHQPAGRPPRSSSALADPAPTFPQMQPTSQPPAGFLYGWKRHTLSYNGETDYRLVTNLRILFQRNVATATSNAPTKASVRFLS